MMHQDDNDSEMFTNARLPSASDTAGANKVVSHPSRKRRLKGREAVKNQSVLWMATKGLFYTWCIFTFVSGFFFVQVPLFNLLVQTFQNNVVVPYQTWYVENGTDAYMVVSSLSVAASLVALFILINLVRKFDWDLALKHAWLKYVWNPLRQNTKPRNKKAVARKAA